jgi:hypothetical protein
MCLSVGALLPGLAVADPPDFFQSAAVVQPDGIWTVEKSVEVYLDSNPSDPFPADGSNTYLYTIANSSGSFVGIEHMKLILDSPACDPHTFSFISTGVDPTGPGAFVTSGIDARVEWYFSGSLLPGQTSSKLVVTSPCVPGTTPALLGGQFAFDATADCLGPIFQETTCDLEIDKTCCIPAPPTPGVDQCEGQVLEMTFEYLDAPCSDSNNNQSGKSQCSGKKAPGSPVDVTFKGKSGGDYIATPDTNIPFQGTFVVTPTGAEFKNSVKMDLKGPDHKQKIKIRTDCSKPLSCDDQFGSLKLIAFETTLGGVIDCNPDPIEGTLCAAEGSPIGTLCDDKLVEVVFEYTGADCVVPLGNDQSGKAECNGDPAGAAPVSVTYTGKSPGDVTVSPAAGILIGQEVRVTATGTDHLKASTKLLIADTGTLQSLEIHTSCSKPLALGDVFGALTVVEMTQKDGQILALGDPGDDIFFNACEVPAAPPEPHCTSKVLELGLVYNGGDCTITNTQEGKATCSGVADPGQPVSITITKDDTEVFADPDNTINFGDGVVISGSPKLKSSTEFDVTGPNGTQSLAIHTSCSKSLNLGDQFGPFEVVSLDLEDDGFISLGGTVEYQFKVTNPNASQADNVFIDDDVIGPIAGPISLDPGEMQTFFVTQQIGVDTTNTATVSGSVGGNACDEGEDTVIVTVEEPPLGPFDCKDAKPLTGLTMIWQGVDDVLVVAYDGNLNDAVLLTQDNVTAGTEVVVTGFSQSPGDKTWEIYAAGADPMVDAPLGISVFHMSCSDPNMNGTEDCGKAEGNSKNDDPGLINDWELEEIIGGSSLNCTP